jgi:hypothetical protein
MSSNGKSSIEISCPVMLCDGLSGCRATFEYGKGNPPDLVEVRPHSGTDGLMTTTDELMTTTDGLGHTQTRPMCVVSIQRGKLSCTRCRVTLYHRKRLYP